MQGGKNFIDLSGCTVWMGLVLCVGLANALVETQKQCYLPASEMGSQKAVAVCEKS